MSDDLQPQAGGEQTTDEQASTGKEESELKRARDEAAQSRIKARNLENELKELRPLAEQFKAFQESQKTEAQKAADRAKAAEDAAAKHQADALTAQRELAVTRLATKAGVDLDLIQYLDLSKLDLTDEQAAMGVLGKLAAARQTANGASNPGRNGVTGQTDDELRQFYFGGGRNKPTIFGG